MDPSITEVEAFNGTSDWSSQSAQTGQAPELRSIPVGDFYYRNRHFNAFALSLVVCCGMYGIYTPEDTAQVLSQLQHLHSPKHITADDIKGVLQKVVLENSSAYKTLRAATRESSLVRGILAPMVAAKCEPMRSFFHVPGHEIPPTWYPRSGALAPIRVALLPIRRDFAPDPAEDVEPKDST